MTKGEIVSLLSDTRKVLVRALITAGFFSAIAFFFSRFIMQALARHVHATLYYFSLSEAFFASVEIALYTGLFFCVPVILVLGWRQFGKILRKRGVSGSLYVILSVALFYIGCIFCYVIVLPSGVGFLLSYQGGPLKAMISMERFFHFCVAMVFAFGGAFELPVFLLLLGKFGLVTSKKLSRTRRYAFLVIVIAASVITPTPDIYNMALLAIPLYMLYEMGIVLLYIGERRLTPKVKSV